MTIAARANCRDLIVSPCFLGLPLCCLSIEHSVFDCAFEVLAYYLTEGVKSAAYFIPHRIRILLTIQIYQKATHFEAAQDKRCPAASSGQKQMAAYAKRNALVVQAAPGTHDVPAGPKFRTQTMLNPASRIVNLK
jgi:hypothetical protein